MSNPGGFMHGSGRLRTAIFLHDRATPTRYELGRKGRYVQIQSDRIWIRWRERVYYLSTHAGKIHFAAPTRKSGDWDPRYAPLRPDHFRSGEDPNYHIVTYNSTPTPDDLGF